MESIFYTGGFSTAYGFHVTAGDDTRNSLVRPGVSAANWMFMVTIRDGLNAILPIDAGTGPDSLAWYTAPDEEQGMISTESWAFTPRLSSSVSSRG
jgi:hypothetical protein